MCGHVPEPLGAALAPHLWRCRWFPTRHPAGCGGPGGLKSVAFPSAWPGRALAALMGSLQRAGRAKANTLARRPGLCRGLISRSGALCVPSPSGVRSRRALLLPPCSHLIPTRVRGGSWLGRTGVVSLCEWDGDTPRLCVPKTGSRAPVGLSLAQCCPCWA